MVPEMEGKLHPCKDYPCKGLSYYNYICAGKAQWNETTQWSRVVIEQSMELGGFEWNLKYV